MEVPSHDPPDECEHSHILYHKTRFHAGAAINDLIQEYASAQLCGHDVESPVLCRFSLYWAAAEHRTPSLDVFSNAKIGRVMPGLALNGSMNPNLG